MNVYVRLQRYLGESFLKWDITNLVEKIKTYFMYKEPFLKKNPSFLEIMWKNMIPKSHR